MTSERVGRVLHWLIPTGARIVFGIILLFQATSKLFGWWSGSPRGSGHAEPLLSWPYWWAGVLELLVGTLLVLGLFTRLAAVLGAGAMAYAYFVTHLPVHWDPIENGGDYAAVLCWALLLLALVADRARFGLDRLRRGRGRRDATATDLAGSVA